MLRLSILLLALLFAAEVRADRCERAQIMLAEAVRVRGLAEKSPVRCRELGQVKYFQEIIDLIKRDLMPPRLEAEERIFKILGLIPQHYPFADCLVKSYAHEAAAFYSPVTKSFVMPEWIPASDLVLIHEATHALQDQYFDLDTMSRSPTVVGDRAMAIGALIEGDAMEVEAEFKAQLTGQHPADIDAEHQIHPEPRCALPDSLSSIFYFVYEYGEQFIKKVKGRFPRDRLFRELPTTTREILHPEVYGSAPALKKLNNPLPSPIVSKHTAKLVYSERLGEFVLRTVLAQFLGAEESGLAAYGWSNDRLAYYVERSTGAELVVWRIEFESAATLERFIAASNQWLSRRFSFPAPDTLTSFVTGAQDGTVVARMRRGNGVTFSIRTLKGP